MLGKAPSSVKHLMRQDEKREEKNKKVREGGKSFGLIHIRLCIMSLYYQC